MPGLGLAALCALSLSLSLSLAAAAAPPPRTYSLYTGASGRLRARHTAPNTGQRAASRYRNWCAYVVSRVVSCVVEDGVATFVRPEYQPCGWGQIQCPRTVTYRSFMKPRYKTAYKMVSEMEWRCCHGYSGDDCSVSHGQYEEENPRTSHREPAGLPEEGGRDWDSSQQMEATIERLTLQVHTLQSTMETMSGRFQEDLRRAVEQVLNGRQPADAALPPDMKNTISEIQSKLHQIDNRVREHDTEIDLLNTIKTPAAGDTRSDVGRKLSDLKEELVREVEVRTRSSCFSCRADIELLRQQQDSFNHRLQELARVFNGSRHHSQLLIEGMHKHISGLTGAGADSCCGEVESVKTKVEEVESKLVSLSEVVVRLEQGSSGQPPDSTSATTQWDEQCRKQLQNLELKLNLTETNLEKRLTSHLKNLRGEFGDRVQENEERLKAVVSVAGNATIFGDWLHGAIGELDEYLAKMKQKLGADGESLASVVSRLNQLDSMVQVAVQGCAQSCRPPPPTPHGRDTTEMVDALTKLQEKDVQHDLQIQDTGRRLHSLVLEGGSLKNRLQQLGGEDRQLRSMIHAIDGRVKHLNSSLEQLEGKLQTSAETSLTFCNAVRGEVRQHKNETTSQMHRLTEELDTVRRWFDYIQNHCASSCSAARAELDSLKEDLVDSGKQHKVILRKIERFNNTLRRFGMVGGNLGLDLGSMQGELQNIMLTFNSVNESVRALDAAVRQHGRDADTMNATFSLTTNKLGADVNKVQEEITDHIEDTGSRFTHFHNELGKFRGDVTGGFRECRDSSEGVERRLSKLETVCIRLDSVSQSLEKIREGLNRHVSSLWNCQREVNATLQRHSGALQTIQDTQLRNLDRRIFTLNHSVTEIRTEVHNFTTQDFIGVDGPPGPPGPRGNPGPQGLPGVSVRVERVSFSAALTAPQYGMGTIQFNKVLVNEGSHYDPTTGIFTVPYDGRYFISAILTGHRNQRIEAVLAKSNTGLARIDSGGFQPEGLENRPVVGPQPAAGSVGIFTIILPLSRGDIVCIDLVTGKLAHSDEPLTVFNGVLLYQDEDI